MAKKIDYYETPDGKHYKNKVAAKRYERGLILSDDIDELEISKPAQDFLKDNWGEVQNIVRRAGGVSSDIRPNMFVPDVPDPRNHSTTPKKIRKKAAK